MAPKKKVLATAKLQIVAAQATPAPPVGTALGQHGVNIMEFCKQYNDATQQFAGQVIPVELTIYEDRSFSFVLKQPPAAELIRKAAGIEKGSGEPNREKVANLAKGSAEPNRNKVGTVTAKQVEDIARLKMPDLNTQDLESAIKTVRGTARSMGLDVVG